MNLIISEITNRFFSFKFSVEKITEKTKLLKNPIKNYGVRSNIDVECGGGDGEATRLDRENLRNKNGVNIGILLLFSLLIGGVTIGVYLLSQQGIKSDH